MNSRRRAVKNSRNAAISVSRIGGTIAAPVWDHVLVLVTGAVLTTGKRTVSAVLRVMGLSQGGDFALYHHVLSQARWDSRAIARQLLMMILERFLPNGPIIIGIDDTIERRWGKKIAARGIYRDPVRIAAAVARPARNECPENFCLRSA